MKDEGPDRKVSLGSHIVGGRTWGEMVLDRVTEERLKADPLIDIDSIRREDIGKVLAGVTRNALLDSSLPKIMPKKPYSPGIFSGTEASRPIPADNKYRNVGTDVTISDECLSTLLMCMPHGYGFMPVLPNYSKYSVELSFGKLGLENRVRVLMKWDDTLIFHIVDGKTFNKDEIRFLAMEIVELIKIRNGIDDGEQNNKGSD